MNKILNKLVFVFLILFFVHSNANSLEEKIKIGVLIPMTGDNKKLGELIIKATRLAIKDINNVKLEVYPKDTKSNPDQALKAAKEFKAMGIDMVIGPIFYKNLIHLNELENITFLSLTNKTINLPNNVISSGVNATSQINAIKRFIEMEGIKKTIFLTPKVDYEIEIKKAIKQSKIKISKYHIYDTEPTKLTKQIEKITKYKIRKQNLADEIKRIENSDLDENDKDRKINKLKKKIHFRKIKF